MYFLVLFVFIFSFQFASAQTPGRINVDFQAQNIEYFGLDGSKKVALTFDDGPGAGTARILDLLKKYQIKATFFVLGKQMKAHPHLVRRIVSEGHLLANHSYSHENLAKGNYLKNPLALMNEVQSTHSLIKQIVPHEKTYYFRAPYSSWSGKHIEVLNQDPELKKYVGPICWDIGRYIEIDNGIVRDAADWQCWQSANMRLSPIDCATGYLHKTLHHRGGVVLLHDIHSQTADLVEYLIPWLIERGYRFVRIDEIRELDNYIDRTNYQGPFIQDDAFSKFQGRCLLQRK